MPITNEPTNLLYNNKKPPYFSTQSSWQDEKGSFELYLDINKREEVLGLFYVLSESDNPWGKTLSDLSKRVEGKTLRQIEQEDFSDLFDEDSETLFLTPLLALRKTIRQHKGEVLPLCEQLDLPAESLLCRCFGVFQDEIHSFLEKRPEGELRDIVDELRVGAGCASCVPKAKKQIQSWRDKIGFLNLSSRYDKNGQYMRILGLAPAYFILKVDDVIQAWLKDQKVDDQFKIEILDLEGYCLKVKIQPEKSVDVMLKTIGDIIEHKLDVRLKVIS